MAAHLLEQARLFAEGEYTDPVAALALLPASVLGAHVRDQRVAANLSQRALARRTGLSINTLRDLERGERTASTRTIQRLLQVSELALVTKPKLAAVGSANHPSQECAAATNQR
jgi:DNA-binding transcriptional regulator YiaG